MFKEKMATPAIPERVYALCKIVEKGPIASSDLKNRMEPDYLGNGSVYFGDYRKAAEELGLINIFDDVISLAVDKNVIKSMSSMRMYINGILETLNTGQFYKVTNAYYETGSDILKKDKNIANLGPLFSKMTGTAVDAMAMRAWRFWASFLGFGYLQDMFIIPNAQVFLSDVIENTEMERNKLYSVSEFVSEITPMAKIVISDTSSRRFSYGVSNGLRALHDIGKIKMEHIHDQEDMWSLYPLKAYSNDPTITHITIL